MSIAKALAKSRWKGAMLAAATAACVAPAAKAAMTVNLSLSPLGGTAPKSLVYLTPNASAASAAYIPIYVYATVTGTAAPTTGTGTSATAPVTVGDFDGLQYLYYNVLNSTTGAALIQGGFGATGGANAPVLAAPFNASGNDASNASSGGGGAQAGTVQNIAGGVSVGANASSVLLTDYAKPRAASAVMSNYATFSGGVYTYANNGTNIVVNGNSVSFLVETLFYKPTAYTASTPTSLKSTTFSVQVPTLPATYTGANYFQDSSTSVATIGANGSSLAPYTGTAYTAGTSVTLTDSQSADFNADGRVNVSDLGILAQNYNGTGKTFAQGDSNGDGVVNVSDLGNLAQQYNTNLGGLPAIPMAEWATFSPALQTDLKSLGFTTAVPEPATIGLFAVAATTFVARRRQSR